MDSILGTEDLKACCWTYSLALKDTELKKQIQTISMI